MDKKHDINYVKQYLRYAMEFEKNVFVLSNAVRQTERRLAIAQQNYDNVEGSRRALIAQKDNYPSFFDSKKKRAIETIKREENALKKDSRRGRIRLAIFFIVAIFLIVLLWTKIDAVGDNVFRFKLFFSGGILYFCAMVALFIGINATRYGSKENLTKAQDELKECTQYELESKIKQFNNKINEAQSLVARKNELVMKTSNSKFELIKSLQEAKKNLDDFYSADIIPTKYRSLNAVSTLYEYIDTGRCSIIEGHGGIYDTYEYDLKLGLIINNLIDINNTLNRLETNQLYLYREIQDASGALSRITNSLVAIEESSDSASKSLAATAIEQQQINAKVQWMAWNEWSKGY